MAIIGVCPKCSASIVETKFGYSCTNKIDCGFHLNYRNLAGLGVPHVHKSVIKALLKNPDAVVELKARESGKSYKKKAWLDKGEEYSAWTIVVDKDFHREEIGSCPKCGGLITEHKYAFKCSDCDFSIKKIYKGTAISCDEFRSLLSGESFEKEFTSKKGFKWSEIVWFSGSYIESEKN